MFRLFHCACLLIVLVKTNPVPQNCPGTHYGQITYNSVADSSDTIIPSFILPLDEITKNEKNNKIDKIYKLFTERLANNPAALHVIKNVPEFNEEDILNYIKNSGSIPNIVNNYIFLPVDEKTENVLKSNKVILESFNQKKSRHDPNKKFCNHEDNTRKTLKRSLEEESKRTNHEGMYSNVNERDDPLNSNDHDDLNQDKGIKKEKKSSTKKRRKDKSKHSTDKEISKRTKIENNIEKPVSNKKKNATHNASQNQGSNLKKTVKIKNNKEADPKKRTEENNRNKDGKNSKTNSDQINKKIYQNDNPSVRYDFNDMYKYIDALLSNYQLTNTNFNSGFPFDYNNFYQLSQPYGINTIDNKMLPHKHRKLQRLHGKRLHKKRSKLKKKQKGKKGDDQIYELNRNSSISKDKTKLSKKEESVSLTDNILKNSDMISLVESEINSSKLFEESMSNNNSVTEESSYYNSYPSFIIGMEDTVPIIFENGFIDDYYPDFTADNKALIIHQDENKAKMYNSDKYHYVSNHNLDLEDYIKKRKELVMHNINPNTKLFFSEKDTNGDVIISEEDVIDNKEGVIKFQSPPILDNPDFRTRKIERESDEKYEPYYYHNVFHDPDEDFNKYYSEKKEIVYPTSYSVKNDVKNTLCNEIDESSSKAKWKKVKDSNVETVYARSKLAKYGLVL